MTRGTLIATGLAAIACSGPHEQAASTSTMTSVEVTGEISRAITEPIQSGCGRSRPAAPRVAAFVNTRQALSCRDLGFALRRISHRAGSGNTVIVVPASDTTEVCEFLRLERVPDSVILIVGQDPRLSEVRNLFAADLDGEAKMIHSYTAVTGTDLISDMFTASTQERAVSEHPQSKDVS